LSNNTQVQINQVPNEPSLSDLLNLLKKEIFLDLNSHHLATIQSFDAERQFVTATVNYTKTSFQRNKQSGVYNPVQLNYPLLVDVPVVVLGGGAARVTFPIQQGDQCLVLFNDRNIDNWVQSGQVGPVANSRAHSFSDGFALIGPNSLASVIDNYDTVRAVLRNGSAGVGVGPSLIKIYNATTTLNTLMQQILSQIETLANAAAAITVTGITGGPGTSGPPVNASALSAVATAITSLATQLGDLIE
jgi:hypothetical protein